MTDGKVNTVAVQALKWPSLLVLLAFVTDLFTPILIWKGLLPGSLRWISHGAIAAMLLLIPFRMISFNRFPLISWLVVLFSLVGIITAMLTGQGIAPTIWGWWLMFQFPLVGLFAFLQPGRSEGLTMKILNGLIFLIGIEVIVQVGQYLTGEIPGDNLAGTFGRNGTGDLVLFLIICLCLALGNWLCSNDWIRLVIVLGFGMVSSILGEMKLFYLAIAMFGMLALIVYVVRGKQIWKLGPAILALATAFLVFIPLYDRFVPSARDLPLEGYFTNPALLTKYLTFVNKAASGTNYYYDIGRNYAVVYGWNKISQNPQDFVMGYGIGSRSESKSLGIVGRGLEEGELGITSGTSMLVFIQETGLLGIITFTLFFLAVIGQLYFQIRQNPKAQTNSIRVGLVLFSLLWPIWLWYNAVWTLRVPMLLYWYLLGYVMNDYFYQSRQKIIQIDQKHFHRISPGYEGDVI